MARRSSPKGSEPTPKPGKRPSKPKAPKKAPPKVSPSAKRVPSPQPDQAKPAKPARAKRAPAPKAREAHATVEKLLAAQPAPETNEHGLRFEWVRFLDEYESNGYNGTRAYMEVYKVQPGTAASNASVLLRNPKIKAELSRRYRAAIGRINLTRDDLVGELAAMVSADPNELSYVRLVACGFCWGHQPPKKGDKNATNRIAADADPDPDCDNCAGQGHEQVRLNDTRRLSPAARALFKGVKVLQGGTVQVLQHDKLAAMDMLNRMGGHYKEDNEQKVPDMVAALQSVIAGIHSEQTGLLPIAAPAPSPPPVTPPRARP